MRPPHKRRLAQRHDVVTTPILWQVARRKKRTARTKLQVAEAAIVEVSVLGAGIVAPDKWEGVPGTVVELYWEGLTGVVVVRRVLPYPNSDNLVLYGVEFTPQAAEFRTALYDRLVQEPENLPPIEEPVNLAPNTDLRQRLSGKTPKGNPVSWVEADAEPTVPPIVWGAPPP